jgi:hypothetical protein
MMTILTNAAFFKAKPGQRDTLGARLLKLVAPTRQEAGCFTRSRHDRSNRPRGQGCLALGHEHIRGVGVGALEFP